MVAFEPNGPQDLKEAEETLWGCVECQESKSLNLHDIKSLLGFCQGSATRSSYIVHNLAAMVKLIPAIEFSISECHRHRHLHLKFIVTPFIREAIQKVNFFVCHRKEMLATRAKPSSTLFQCDLCTGGIYNSPHKYPMLPYSYKANIPPFPFSLSPISLSFIYRY